MKEKTLEQVAGEYSKRSTAPVFQEAHKQDFIAGAKWQAEQLLKDEVIQTLEKGLELLLKKQQNMYSEEEVKHIISEALQSALVTVDLEKWFEQFNKLKKNYVGVQI